MDVREKLVELLDETFDKQYDKNLVITARNTANHLIAHGVTVYEWISVEDMFPEDSANVLVCHKNGLTTTNAWLDNHWWFKNDKNPVTHWMPLPEPPEMEG